MKWFYRTYFRLRGTLLALILLPLLPLCLISQEPFRPWWLIGWMLGMLIRLAAARSISRESSWSHLAASELIQTRLYRISRNPLYLSNLVVLMCGLLFLNVLPVWGLGLFLLLFWMHHSVLVHIEEAFLHQRWGDAYRLYQTQTQRWLSWSRLREFFPIVFTDWRSGVNAQRNHLLKANVSLLFLFGVKWYY